MSDWLWGRRVVNEVLRGSNREVESVWIESGRASDALDEIRAAAERRGVGVRDVDADQFAGPVLDHRNARNIVGVLDLQRLG